MGKQYIDVDYTSINKCNVHSTLPGSEHARKFGPENTCLVKIK